MQNQNNERGELDLRVAVQGVALHQRVEPKCANPSCPVAFHWLVAGRFFRFSDRHCDTCAGKANAKSLTERECGGHCVKHFWLCETCSNVFMLVYQKPEGVILRLRWTELPEPEMISMAHKLVAA